MDRAVPATGEEVYSDELYSFGSGRLEGAGPAGGTTRSVAVELDTAPDHAPDAVGDRQRPEAASALDRDARAVDVQPGE